jgi:hypothetical protein
MICNSCYDLYQKAIDIVFSEELSPELSSPELQPEPDNTHQVVMYSEFPDVPDFGAFLGITMLEREDYDSNNVAFRYPIQSAHDEHYGLEQYSELLIYSGFMLTDTFPFERYAFDEFTKGDIIVCIGKSQVSRVHDVDFLVIISTQPFPPETVSPPEPVTPPPKQDLSPGEELHQAIIDGHIWIDLLIYWNDYTVTYFEYNADYGYWYMQGRTGDNREVYPDFTLRDRILEIRFPTTSRVYYLHEDTTGVFGDESFMWDFELR